VAPDAVFVTFVFFCANPLQVRPEAALYYYPATSCFPEKIFSHKKAQKSQKHRRYSAVPFFHILCLFVANPVWLRPSEAALGNIRA